MHVDGGGVEDISRVRRAVAEVYGEVVAAGSGIHAREAEVDGPIAVDSGADSRSMELGVTARGHAAREVAITRLAVRASCCPP